MGTRAQLLEWASRQVGHVGGEMYWRILQGWSGGGYDWCAVFCSCALKQTDTPCNYFPSTYAFDWIHDHETIGSAWVDKWQLQEGDMISFHWPIPNDPRPYSGDHVGIVEKVLGSGTYQTIEGNVSNSVGRRIRRVSDGIIGGIRPRYEEDEVTEAEMDRIAAKVWQRAINFKNGANDKPWNASAGDRLGYIDYDTHTLNKKLDTIIELLQKPGEAE